MKSTILKKKIATKWFKDLRNLICQEFIDLEKKYKERFYKYSNAWDEPLCVCNNKPAKIIINYHF